MVKLYGLFFALCLIWGLTWIPIKIGVEAMPPSLFAATRFSAAGLGLLLWRWRAAGLPRVQREYWPRLLAVSLCMITLTYGPLFWGMTRISSGLAAVANLAVIPLFLMGFAVLLREESLSPPRAVAALMGGVGLALLFRGDLEVNVDRDRLLGIGAVTFGSLAYCVGTVLSRPLLRAHSPAEVSGWANGLGSVLLFAGSVAFEPESPRALVRLFEPKVLASWAMLVFFGSILAMTMFLRLTRDWSPSQAGAYAFVSPMIAVLAGVVLLDERVGRLDMLAMALMLVAALLVVKSPRTSPGRGYTPAARDAKRK